MTEELVAVAPCSLRSAPHITRKSTVKSVEDIDHSTDMVRRSFSLNTAPPRLFLVHS